MPKPRQSPAFSAATEPAPLSSDQPPATARRRPSQAARAQPEPVPQPAIRVLTPADAPAFHALRLEALAQHPEAFRATFDEEADQSVAEVERRLAAQTVVGAWIDGALAGVAGFETQSPVKKRHKGLLWGVYVRPQARCAGLGTALVEGVIAHARARVEQLHTVVVVDNAPARHLYRKLGFRPYGIEPRALKVGDRYHDQELLVLMLER